MTQKAYCNKKTYEFTEKFKKEKGTLLCRELLGVDIQKPEDFNTPESKEAHKTVCPKAIAAAVRIFSEMDFEN